MNVQVFGDEAEAVKVGTIEGEIYDDGEVFADEESLAAYRAAHPEAPKSNG
jgi:hypothetical protein